MRSRLVVLGLVVLLGMALLSSQAGAVRQMSGDVDSITEGPSGASATPRGQRQDDGGDPDGVGLDRPGPGESGFIGGTTDLPANTEQESGDDPLGYYARLLALVIGLTW